MSASSDPYLGRKIRGYRLEHLLQHGSSMSIYRARTRELWLLPEIIVTIFHLPKNMSKQARDRFRDRFEQESEQLITLRHPHLFPLYGYGEEEGIFYHITPDAPGELLTTRLKHQKQWSAQAALQLLTRLADLLEYLHERGRVFLYLNKNTIFLNKDDEVQVMKLGQPQILSASNLSDQKLSLASYEHLKSITGSFLSAPEYLAPEVVRGAEGDKRSDVYSLGVLLFELLSGRPPFMGETFVETVRKHVHEPLPSLHEIAPETPVALELVINHALQRDPERRFQSPQALITALAHVLQERLYTSSYNQIAQTIQQIRALAEPQQTRVVSSTLHLPEQQQPAEEQAQAEPISFYIKKQQAFSHLQARQPVSHKPLTNGGDPDATLLFERPLEA